MVGVKHIQYPHVTRFKVFSYRFSAGVFVPNADVEATAATLSVDDTMLDVHRYLYVTAADQANIIHHHRQHCNPKSYRKTERKKPYF